MKKKLKIITVLLATIVFLGGCGKFMNNEKSVHEKQVEFLKAHEQELIDGGFVVDGEPWVKDIVFDWDTAKTEKAGVIIAEPYAVSVEVKGIVKKTGKSKNWKMIVDVSNPDDPYEIDSIGFSNEGEWRS